MDKAVMDVLQHKSDWKDKEPKKIGMFNVC